MIHKSATASGAKNPELLPFVRALAQGGFSGSARHEAPSPVGVRTLKSRLSQFLNDATFGHLTVVEAGSGRSVLLIGTDALADALMALQNTMEMTFGAALDSLPHNPTELPSLSLEGSPPDLHIEKSDILKNQIAEKEC
jgi:hypothetical protein